MSRTEAKAAAGGGLTPVQEAQEAVTGFLSEFKNFQTELETKLQQQEERMTMLDRKTVTHARTPLGAAADMEAPHQKAFNAYLRSGDDADLRGLELEGKALSTAVNADGGYLVDPQTSETVKSVLDTTASIRAIADVVNDPETKAAKFINKGFGGVVVIKGADLDAQIAREQDGVRALLKAVSD